MAQSCPLTMLDFYNSIKLGPIMDALNLTRNEILSIVFLNPTTFANFHLGKISFDDLLEAVEVENIFYHKIVV